ncbi:MAG TPA: hypothetical protein VIS07_10690 [Candidatus Binatia bacterium]
MNPSTIRLALASLLVLALGGADAARAATIQVTMKKDVVADDGRCSLREAVTAANTNRPSGRTPGECVAGDPHPVVDVIKLRRGGYVLKLGGAGDDLDLGGDLDIAESVRIEGRGFKTKVKNRIGKLNVVGDGDRVFHVDPQARGGVDAFLVNMTITRGDVGCTGDGCATGASAIEMNGPGQLTIERAAVVRNTAKCVGESCNDDRQGAAIRAVGAGRW